MKALDQLLIFAHHPSVHNENSLESLLNQAP